MSNYGEYKPPVDGTQALSREQWLQIAQDLMQVGPILQEALCKAASAYPNAAEIMPVLDPGTFEADIRCACAAIAYVAEFAADQCRFIITEGD